MSASDPGGDLKGGGDKSSDDGKKISLTKDPTTQRPNHPTSNIQPY